MARKNQPQEGENCPCGAFEWVQYSNGMWYCRPCRTKSSSDWLKHQKAMYPEKYKEQRNRYRKTSRTRAKERDEQRGA